MQLSIEDPSEHYPLSVCLFVCLIQTHAYTKTQTQGTISMRKSTQINMIFGLKCTQFILSVQFQVTWVLHCIHHKHCQKGEQNDRWQPFHFLRDHLAGVLCNTQQVKIRRRALHQLALMINQFLGYATLACQMRSLSPSASAFYSQHRTYTAVSEPTWPAIVTDISMKLQNRHEMYTWG